MKLFIALVKLMARHGNYEYNKVFRNVLFAWIVFDILKGVIELVLWNNPSINLTDYLVWAFFWLLLAGSWWEAYVFQSKLPDHLKHNGWK